MGLSDLSQQCAQIALYRQALFGSPPPTSWPTFSTPTVTEKSKSRQESRPTQNFRTFPHPGGAPDCEPAEGVPRKQLPVSSFRGFTDAMGR